MNEELNNPVDNHAVIADKVVRIFDSVVTYEHYIIANRVYDNWLKVAKSLQASNPCTYDVYNLEIRRASRRAFQRNGVNKT